MEKPDRFTARDVAKMQILACQRLGIEKLYAAIGGSLGGGLVWEMAVSSPGYVETIIPVAADWKASDTASAKAKNFA